MNEINKKIHALTTEGLTAIREYLTENGSLENIEEDNLWIAFFTALDGNGDSSHYSEIELDESGEITVGLTNGLWLYEDNLTTNHVMDILTIIEERHGYSKQEDNN